MKKGLPKSIRKFIREEKARIRRENLNLEKQKKLISDIYQRFVKKDKKTAIIIEKEKVLTQK